MRFIILLITLLTLVSCGNHPLSKTREQRLDLIKNFFAAALEPEPEIASKEVPLREVCLQHVMALYFVINDPQQLKAAHIPDTIIAAIAGKDLERLKDQPLEVITKALKEMDPKFFIEMQQTLDKAIEEFRFETGALSAISLPKLGEAWTKFFQNILENYFPQLSLKDRKHVLAYMISKMPENPDDIDRLLNAVHASGPYLHKYFQLMADKLEPGNDAKLSKLRDGLLEVKNALPPIPKRDLDAYMAELKAKGIVLTNLQSLGAASVGQAFKATLNGEREIVVKFRRPGIEEVARREREFFNNMAKMAQGEALRQSFDDIAAQIQEEFDYNIEYDKIKAGIKAYERDGYQIHVVRPVEDFPRTERYFAMEYVDGMTFKNLGKNQFEKHVKGLLWEKLTAKFLRQALFSRENMFFHGDLHEGNIMVQLAPELGLPENAKRQDVEKAINEGKIKLVLVDFGNAHNLTKEQSIQIRNVFLSGTKISMSADVFLRSIDPKLKNAEPLLSELRSTVFTKENRDRNSPMHVIGAGMDFVLGKDIPVPALTMAFKRSLAMLHESEPEKGRSLHVALQDAYVSNLPQLLTDLSERGFEDLLEGIILGAQAAEFEGEKLADFLQGNERGSFRDEWIKARTELANADNTQKKDKFWGLLNLLKEHAPKTLQTSPEKKKDVTEAPKGDVGSDAAKDILNLILDGKVMNWEKTQFQAIGGDPEKWKAARNQYCKASDVTEFWGQTKCSRKLWNLIPKEHTARLVQEARQIKFANLNHEGWKVDWGLFLFTMIGLYDDEWFGSLLNRFGW